MIFSKSGSLLPTKLVNLFTPSLSGGCTPNLGNNPLFCILNQSSYFSSIYVMIHFVEIHLALRSTCSTVGVRAPIIRDQQKSQVSRNPSIILKLLLHHIQAIFFNQGFVQVTWKSRTGFRLIFLALSQCFSTFFGHVPLGPISPSPTYPPIFYIFKSSKTTFLSSITF